MIDPMCAGLALLGFGMWLSPTLGDAGKYVGSGIVTGAGLAAILVTLLGHAH